MSELEILRRQTYKRNRKKWSVVQLVAIAVLVAMALVSFLVYNRMNRTQYIEYTESGSIDYSVQYADNEFFPDEWIDKDQSYISALVEGMNAEFAYKLNTSSPEMKYDYKYSISAKLLIASRDKGTPYYVFEEVLVPEKGGRIENSDHLYVKEKLDIDFKKYDRLARSFVNTYGLDSSSSSTLIVTLNVRSECANNGFSQKNNIVYTTALNVPLAKDTFNIHRTSGSTEGEAKTLEYVGGANREFFLTLSTGSGIAAFLMLLILLAFLQLTKNEDITYSAKVRKILRSYGSFIQRMDGEFDCDGYQIVNIKTFTEMLGIRDTIQSPVLMSENKDETMTRFYIPTNTKILYVFEIKVDNYDSIYGVFDVSDPYADLDDGADETVAEETVEETVTEETVVEETAVEETVTEEVVEDLAETEVKIDGLDDSILEKLTVVESEGDESGEEILAYVDEQGNIVRITCTRSFTANLIQSNPQVKDYYNQIKNHILSYNGVKTRMSWRNESYKKGRIQLFKMKIRGKTICLYCALDPSEYAESRYFHEVATAKVYAAVPMMVRIKSDRGLKRAKELVDDVMKKFVILPNEKAEFVDFAADHPFDSTKNLVKRRLIKLLIPDAILAEPKPHHENEKKIEVVKEEEGVVEEVVLFNSESVDEQAIEEMNATPTPDLAEIDFVDNTPEIVEFVETEEKPGVDVIGVVWPERPKRNKIYRYDPDGETVSVGDVVIVPTRDAASNKDVIRKAAVAHANYKVPADDLKHPLKKIVGVIRKKVVSELQSTESGTPTQPAKSTKAKKEKKTTK